MTCQELNDDMPGMQQLVEIAGSQGKTSQKGGKGKFICRADSVDKAQRLNFNLQSKLI